MTASASPIMPTIALLFEADNENIEARWRETLAIAKAEKIAVPTGVEFNAHGTGDTIFKQILCKIGMDDVRANIRFKLPIQDPIWIFGPGRRDEVLSGLVRIINLMEPSHIWWLPAGIVTERQYFMDGIRRFLDENHGFPVLAFANFKQDEHGIIRSRGLKWFCGQEIEYRPGVLLPHESMRRIIRLAHSMITEAPILSDMIVDGLDAGEHYKLSMNDQRYVVMTPLATKDGKRNVIH